MSTIRPTKKQKELLEFIDSFIKEYGYSPSYREIMSGCNYNSVATVALHVNSLIKRGHLIKREHSARSLEVVGATNSQPVSKDGKEWFVSEVERHFSNPKNVDDLYVLLGALKILGLEQEFETYKQKLIDTSKR